MLLSHLTSSPGIEPVLADMIARTIKSIAAVPVRRPRSRREGKKEEETHNRGNLRVEDEETGGWQKGRDKDEKEEKETKELHHEEKDIKRERETAKYREEETKRSRDSREFSPSRSFLLLCLSLSLSLSCRTLHALSMSLLSHCSHLRSFFSQLRKTKTEEEYIRLAMHYFNLLLSNSADSDLFWRLVLPTAMQAKFGKYGHIKVGKKRALLLSSLSSLLFSSLLFSSLLFAVPSLPLFSFSSPLLSPREEKRRAEKRREEKRGEE
jgi:hypothetical protein